MGLFDVGLRQLMFYCTSGLFNTTQEDSLAPSWEPSTTVDIQLLMLTAKQGGLGFWPGQESNPQPPLLDDATRVKTRKPDEKKKIKWKTTFEVLGQSKIPWHWVTLADWTTNMTNVEACVHTILAENTTLMSPFQNLLVMKFPGFRCFASLWFLFTLEHVATSSVRCIAIGWYISHCETPSWLCGWEHDAFSFNVLGQLSQCSDLNSHQRPEMSAAFSDQFQFIH